MADARFVPVRAEHIEQLAATLRAADLAECLVSGFSSALEAVALSVERSDLAGAWVVNGRVGAIFGCTATGSVLGPPVEGIAWVLTSEVVRENPLRFYRDARRALAEMQRYCPVLFNFVDGRYAGALRFTASLGFKVSPPAPWGPNGQPFCRIERGA